MKTSRGNTFGHRIVRAIITLAALVTIIATNSCSSDKTESQLQKAGNLLQNAENSVDDWGKVSISDLLIVENTGQFKITYDEDTSNYVAAARGNFAGVSSAEQAVSQYTGASLTAQLTAPISTGSAPTAGTSNALPTGTIPSPAAAALSNLTPILANTSPVIDERTAAHKGINDKLAELLLKFMANPDVGSNQQTVVFGIMQVTCQPGIATRKDYAANVNVSIKYARQRGTVEANMDSAVPNRSGKYEYKSVGGQPSVIAVLPLVDSQNLALDNSSFNQLEVALQLAAAFSAKGVSVGASLLNDYIKRQESEVDTRNSVPVITSYTDGSTFGFEIYPSLMAQTNPGNSSSSPGDILQPITFPAVVAILIDKSDLGQTQSPIMFVSGNATLSTQKTTVIQDGDKPQVVLGRVGTFSLDKTLAVFPQSNQSRMTTGSGAFNLTNRFPNKLDDSVFNGAGSFVLTNTPSSLLRPSDVLDPKLFVKDLNQDDNAFSKYLRWVLQSTYDDTQLQSALATKLDKVIESGSAPLFDMADKTEIIFRPEAVALLDANPSLPELRQRLVRLALEDAYPTVFAKIGPRLRATGSLKAIATKSSSFSDASVALTVMDISPLIPSNSLTKPKAKLPVTIIKPLKSDPAIAPPSASERRNSEVPIAVVATENENADALPPQQPSQTPPNTSNSIAEVAKNMEPTVARLSDSEMQEIENHLSGSDAMILGFAQSPDPGNQSIPSGDGSGDGLAAGSWNLVQTELRTDWLPIQKGGGNTLKMEARLDRAEDVDRASKMLEDLRNQFNGQYPTDYWYRAEQIEIALDSLKTVALGTERLSSLPSDLFVSPPKGPKILDAFPHIIWRDQSTSFTISVTNFSHAHLVSIAGIGTADLTDVHDYDTFVTGTVKHGTFGSIIGSTNSVEFVVKDDNGVVLGKTVTLTLMGKVADYTKIGVNRDNRGNWTGLSVESSPTLSSSNALNAAQSILEKSEPLPKTTNIVP